MQLSGKQVAEAFGVVGVVFEPPGNKPGMRQLEMSPGLGQDSRLSVG
jgi:hypothetical protein